MKQIATSKLWKFKNGKWLVWIGEVFDKEDGTCIVRRTYGQEGGSLVPKEYLVTEGKNIGRANETTVQEQAISELQSNFNKKMDKGYQIDKIKSVPLRPMLAQSYAKHSKKIVFPAAVQPKLDGVRCVVAEGCAMSRNGKRFQCLEHLEKQAKKFKLSKDEALDGELFIPGNTFQQTVSRVKQEKTQSPDVQLHVFDLIHDSLPFATRLQTLKDFNKRGLFGKCMKLVPTFLVANDKEMMARYHKFLDQGYEGLMIRNIAGRYKLDKRSYDLQKVKQFQTEEFKIVDADADKDGGVRFECKHKRSTFGVRPKGTLAERKQMLKDKKKVIGKMLTVEFFEWTDDGMPRFPVGLVIRDYE